MTAEGTPTPAETPPSPPIPPAATPVDVLVVASWFPSVEDPGAGRFVADQAEALAATGVARVAVVTFDPARLTGGAASRGHQARAVLDASLAAVAAADPLFVAPAWGVDPGLPVARLSIPEGLTAAAGPAHTAVHRGTVLGALGRRLAGERGPDSRGVVHAHTVYPDGAAAVALADALGWPLVLTEHSSFVERIVGTPAVRDRYAAAVTRSYRTFAVSEMLAGELRATFPELASRIDVLPNAVPLDLFPAGPLEDRVADELLFVGYRKTTKGIENLLRAVAVARRRRPAITLRLVGRSPDDATELVWLDLVRSLGLEGAVAFDEAVDRAGIAAAMRRASLFVHPSPRETFGVVAVEALASGLPVVATDSGGVTEILGSDAAAFGAIVPTDDPQALGDAIVAALERRESFDPAALRAAVERRFAADFVAERLVVAYRAALAAVAVPDEELPSEDEPAGWSSGSATVSERVVIVGLDRERAAERLTRLPEALRATVELVTATEPHDVALPPVGRLLEVAVDATWRPKAASPTAPLPRGRLARLLRDPIGTVRRRLGRDAGAERSVAPATAAIRRHLDAAGASGGSAVELLPLDGHDEVAVRPLVLAGRARRFAGGLRHLADTAGPSN